jgi:hypothetical protein
LKTVNLEKGEMGKQIADLQEKVMKVGQPSVYTWLIIIAALLLGWLLGRI